MRVEVGFAKVKRVEGMTRQELAGYDEGEVQFAERPMANYYIVGMEVHVYHDVMDQDDQPLNYEAMVRVPILDDDEPFSAIVERARTQLRLDALSLASALEGDE